MPPTFGMFFLITYKVYYIPRAVNEDAAKYSTLLANGNGMPMRAKPCLESGE
jgi:hypothetical protein